MKRMVCALLAVALLLGVAVLSVSATSVLYGDVNADGKINNRDLGMLQQYLNDLVDESKIDMEAADVRHDGKVNNRDLGLLQQYLNDLDVTLGPEVPEEPDVPTPPDEPPVPDVPAAALPSVGYDIDGRGRVLIDAISQEGYTVTVTVHNHSTKWITEETSCVEYICTDAEGNVLYVDDKYYGTLYLGMLEVDESATFTITLPEGTAKMEFGDYRIVYWSPWEK